MIFTSYFFFSSSVDPVESLQLRSCVNLYQTRPSELTFSLSQFDMDRLENFFSLGKRNYTTFLRVLNETGITERVTGRELLPTTNPVPVSQLTNPLRLLRFDLDMNTGHMILYFNDEVSESSLDVTALTIQDGRRQVVGYTLTGSSNISFQHDSSGQNRTVTDLLLLISDLNSLKANQNLTTGLSDSYLTVSSSLAQSTQGSDVVPVVDGEALGVSLFTEDTTAPLLVEWSLDLDGSMLILTFSEVVDTLTLNATTIGLLDANSTTPYYLSGFSVSASPAAIFSLRLLDEDANQLKLAFYTGTRSGYNFLTLGQGAILDMNGNPVEEVSRIQVNNLVHDTSRPYIESFTLDMDSGTFVLTYSEIVDVTTIFSGRYFRMRVYNYNPDYSNYDPDTSFFIELNSRDKTVSRDSNYSSIVEVTLGGAELENLKITPNIATSIEDTSLNSNGLISDLNGNAQRFGWIQATDIIPDTTPPMLTSFSLNLCTQQLILTFTEQVNRSTVNSNDFVVNIEYEDPFFPGPSMYVSTQAGGRAGALRIGLFTETLSKVIAIQLFVHIPLFTSISVSLAVGPNAASDYVGNTMSPISFHSPITTTTNTTICEQGM